jgi:hypothetical protein
VVGWVAVVAGWVAAVAVGWVVGWAVVAWAVGGSGAAVEEA